MIRTSGVLVLMLVFASPLLLPSHNCSASDSVFSVHPKNHRCFLYQGKPMKILTSAEHYGAVINGEFDYDVYLKELRRTGQNQTRVFTFYREEWRNPVLNTLAPTPQSTVLPWRRVSGHGKGPDGLGKFDLNQWNPAYFARLKDYVQKCAEHGVICEIVLFCNPYNEKQYAWFPCNKAGNVNGVGEDCDDYRQFMTLEAPSVVAFQERFVRKVVQDLNEFDNVYYEICNEPYSKTFPKEWTKRGEAWHAHMARAIRQVEKDLPNRHSIAANVPNNEAILKNPDIDILNHHYPPGTRIWQLMRQRDRYRKPLVFDENYSGIVGKKPAERYAINRAEAWLTILSGCAGFSNLDWTFTAADESGSGKAPLRDGRKIDGRPLREWLDIFRQLLGQYDVARLVPAVEALPDRISGYEYAATTDGKGKYILYFVDKRLFESKPCPAQPLEISIKLPGGRYAADTFDPKTGKTTTMSPLQSDGTLSLKIPEFREDVAVSLEREP